MDSTDSKAPFASRILFAIPILLALFVLAGVARPSFAAPAAQEDEPAQAEPTPAAVATPLPGVPVELGGRVILFVREGVGSLSPGDRATLIEQRLEQLANDPFAPPLELTQIQSPIGIDIMDGDAVLVTITPQDAAAIDMDLQTVADRVIEVIEEEVTRTRQLNTPGARIIRIVEAVAVLAVVVLLLLLINRLYHRLVRRIEGIDTKATSIGFLSTSQFYHSGQWKRWSRWVLNFLRWLLFIVLIIYGLPVALQLLPATAVLAGRILGYVLTPLRIVWQWMVGYQDDFVTILVILLAVYVLMRLVKAFFKEVAEGSINLAGFEADWAPFTARIVRFLLLIGAVIIIFPYLPGSGSDAFRGITIFLGALFTLSSTAAVTNIVAGIIQTYTGAFRNGDVIKIGEVTGTVLEKRLLVTRLSTFKNEEVSIPNSLVLSTNVTNFTAMARQKGLVLHSMITIGYDVPWQQVHELMIAAALGTADVLSEPRPFVLQTSLNDFNVAYEINCYSQAPERMPRIYSELHKNIQEKFNAAGVEIMSPSFSALRDGNAITIPEEFRPQDYQAPGIRVETAE